MRIAKIGVIALFLFMALGGIGGVMLAGYTFILRDRKSVV